MRCGKTGGGLKAKFHIFPDETKRMGCWTNQRSDPLSIRHLLHSRRGFREFGEDSARFDGFGNYVWRSKKCQSHRCVILKRTDLDSQDRLGRSKPFPGCARALAQGPPPARVSTAGYPRQAPREGQVSARNRRSKAGAGRYQAGQCAIFIVGGPVQEQGLRILAFARNLRGG